MQNIIKHGYEGELYTVNPKENIVQGIKCYTTCKQLPNVDLAIIAVSANYVEEVMQTLAFEKKSDYFDLYFYVLENYKYFLVI